MKVGIAFSGGGLKGAYEVGVYKAFQSAHIKVDGFVGTSIGSFNAAMCASGKFKELYEFWYKEDLGSILGFSEKLVTKANMGEYDLDLLSSILDNIKDVVLNKGISTYNLRKRLEEFNIEPELRKSKKDFGLVTVRFNGFEPLYLFKDSIPFGKLNDFIMASCYLPIFKLEKLIDDNYYLDGGFHDNIPVSILLERNYDKVYVVDLEAIGLKRPYKDKKKIIVIKPSKKLSSILNFKQEEVRNSIKMGYYDTIKILKEFDGKKYIFKKRSNTYYDKLLSSVNKLDKELMEKLFSTKNSKRLVIKTIEFVMKKEKFTYYNIYDVKEVIKRIRYINKKHQVYKFITMMNI